MKSSEASEMLNTVAAQIARRGPAAKQKTKIHRYSLVVQPAELRLWQEAAMTRFGSGQKLAQFIRDAVNQAAREILTRTD